MNRILLLLMLFVTPLCAQDIEHTYRNPVIAGDLPDPTIIRVGEDYYASGTTSHFAPAYPLYHSRDLINWEQIGSVFNEIPDWIKGDCWAPELFYHNDTFYVYYTARKKSDNTSCIGVATTRNIRHGFTDHGPLIEWGSEAIDAFVFNDEGKLYITWKAYGLDPERPIEILASELSADGLQLVGEHFSLTRHDEGWIGQGDEGQCIIKHGDYYYHFYSVGGCCDRRCDYRVEVARAKSLRGEWEQFEGNPILEGGGLWKCSGHGTVVQTPDGRYFYLYHAYHAYDFVFVGRQGLLDEIMFDEQTQWPYFRFGKNPTAQAPVPFAGTVQEVKSDFFDHFGDKKRQWLSDMTLPTPHIHRNRDGLVFASEEPGMCVYFVNPHTGNYQAGTQVSNQGSGFSGLCVYGSNENLFAWGIEHNSVKLYRIEGNRKEEVYTKHIGTDSAFLRIESFNARSFAFAWSVDGDEWITYPEKPDVIDGYYIPAWGRGVRVGLIIDTQSRSDKALFRHFHLLNR